MGPWKHEPTAEKLDLMSNGTLMQALGIRFLGIEDDALSALMPVDERTRQPFGLLHGGASAALIETLGSTASHLCIDHESSFSVGLEVNATHLRPMRQGEVRGEARPIHLGRSIHIWEVRITDAEGKLVCIGKLTCAIRSKSEPAN